jgi:hypothetical protein
MASQLTSIWTRRDKGNDAGFNINVPTVHDKSSGLGAVRSSRRSGRRPAAGYAYGCAQITRSGTASGDRHSHLIADHNGGSVRVAHVEGRSHSVAAGRDGPVTYLLCENDILLDLTPLGR